MLRPIPQLPAGLVSVPLLRKSWFATAPRLSLQGSRGVELGTPGPAVDVGSLFILVKDNGATAPSVIVVGALSAVFFADFEPTAVHQEYTCSHAPFLGWCTATKSL